MFYRVNLHQAFYQKASFFKKVFFNDKLLNVSPVELFSKLLAMAEKTLNQ